MKVKVKATGDFIDVTSKIITSPATGKSLLKYIDSKTGISYFKGELFFPKDLADDLDYWTRLEHTYAGMAMQGALANADLLFSLCKDRGDCPVKVVAVEFANACAHALVEKMKEER